MGKNWITGGAILGASGISSATNIWAQNSKNQNNIYLQEQSQEFQEYMASTNYQRAVKDMQAAGLNPALAAGGTTSSAPVMQQSSHNSQLGKAKILQKWKDKNY